MSEKEKLIYVQGVIDRLLYLKAQDRAKFLSKLDKILNDNPIERDIKYILPQEGMQEANQG